LIQGSLEVWIAFYTTNTGVGLDISIPTLKPMAPTSRQSLSSPGWERNKVRDQGLKESALSLLHKPLTLALSPRRGRSAEDSKLKGAKRGSAYPSA